MQYLYNDDYGFMFYPEGWRDVPRLLLLRLVLPEAKGTWHENFRDLVAGTWMRVRRRYGAANVRSMHTVEVRIKHIEETQYPNLCAGG